MIATKANMKAVEDQTSVLAYSPETGEEYSANPNDYWNMPDDESLKDENGEPMILVRRVTYLESIDEPVLYGGEDEDLTPIYESSNES